MVSLSALFVFGCSQSAGQPVIDGFPVGDAVACSATNQTCVDIVSMGRSVFDQRMPSHAAVTTTTVYYEGPTNPRTGEAISRNGEMYIVVFTLADGSRHAAGVYCGFLPCTPFATYPD